MKLLVSDFDGTLNPELFGSIYSNLSAVDNFRKQGNLFMLSTGRNYDSIKKQIDRYKIRYDYLACNDGGIVFDHTDEILNASYMEKSLISSLVNELENIESVKKYHFFGDKNVIEDGNIIELQADIIPSKINEVKDYILNKYPEVSIMVVGREMFIELKGGKTRAINHILTVDNIKEVYTIGDSMNDIDMLTDFNGYKIFLGSFKLLNKNIKTTLTVKSLVKKINML